MTGDESITHWIAEAKEGDAAAMEAIWERYFRRLVGLARTRLKGTPRRVADEEDVALHAMESFFREAQNQRFPLLQDRDDLWRLLVKITVRKAINLRQATLAKKRGGGLVRGESAFLPVHGDDDYGRIDNAVAAELTPEFADRIFHGCDELLAQLEDETLRTIAVRKLEGYTNAEIAADLGCVERTIDRKLARIRAIWKDYLSQISHE